MAARDLMALDIGGANIKVVTMKQEGSGKKHQLAAATHIFPIWQRADELAGFLRAVCPAHPACQLAVTLTAELADVFPTKREGVAFVLKAVQEAFPGREIRVLTLDGKLEDLNNVLRDPLQAAGANWTASAWAAARVFPEGILGDTGSTTTDLIPFNHGHSAAVGRTDPERLACGELIYTGCLRTPCSHLASKVPWRGGYCRVSPENFTIAGDVHLLLGHIQPGEYQWPTPDGRGTTPADARARLARLVCGDAEMLSEGEIVGIARYLYHCQIEQVTRGLFQVLSRLERPVPLICAGSGRFLLEAAASRVGQEAIGLERVCGARQAEAFPAWSLCLMLATQQEGMKILDELLVDD
jgi:hypothetical protein